jgi:hypothetical protein
MRRWRRTIAVPAPAPRSTITQAAPNPASPHWKPGGEDTVARGAEETIEGRAGPLVAGPPDISRTNANAADGALSAAIIVAAISKRLIDLNMTSSYVVGVHSAGEAQVEHPRLGGPIDRKLVPKTQP